MVFSPFKYFQTINEMVMLLLCPPSIRYGNPKQEMINCLLRGLKKLHSKDKSLFRIVKTKIAEKETLPCFKRSGKGIWEL